MAKAESFDVVSVVNMQEVDNAINQTNKEIKQRYDFKKSKSEVSVEEEHIKIIADDDFKLKSVVDILETKLVGRKVPIRNLEYGKVEEASGGTVRQLVKLKQGIESETSRKMVKDIKGLIDAFVTGAVTSDSLVFTATGTGFTVIPGKITFIVNGNLFPK